MCVRGDILIRLSLEYVSMLFAQLLISFSMSTNSARSFCATLRLPSFVCLLMVSENWLVLRVVYQVRSDSPLKSKIERYTL